MIQNPNNPYACRFELLFTVFDACRCEYYDFIKHIFDENPSNSLGQIVLWYVVNLSQLKHLNIYQITMTIGTLYIMHYVMVIYGDFRIVQMLLHN